MPYIYSSGLLRVAYALVRKQVLYQVPQMTAVTA